MTSWSHLSSSRITLVKRCKTWMKQRINSLKTTDKLLCLHSLWDHLTLRHQMLSIVVNNNRFNSNSLPLINKTNKLQGFTKIAATEAKLRSRYSNNTNSHRQIKVYMQVYNSISISLPSLPICSSSNKITIRSYKITLLSRLIAWANLLNSRNNSNSSCHQAKLLP